MNSKNKMQMLCMEDETTAEGYNQRREPRNIMHSSTESCGRYNTRESGPQMKEHKLIWTRPYSSHLFEGANAQPGFFIPRSNTKFKSTCWIRAMILVDGSWLITEGVDFWRPVSKPVDSRNWEMLPQRPYIDDLAPLCVFVEPVQDFESRPPFLGLLMNIGLKDLIGPVVDIEEVPKGFRSVFQHGVDTDSFVDYFDDYVVQPEIKLYRLKQITFQYSVTVDPIVQIETAVNIAPDPTESVSPSQLQPDAFLNSPSPSTSVDSPMRFTTDDIPLGDDDQISLPPATLLRMNLRMHSHSSEPPLIRFTLSTCREEMMLKSSRMCYGCISDTLSGGLLRLQIKQDRTSRGLFSNVRQEVQLQRATLSPEILESRREIRAQQAALSTDLENKFKGGIGSDFSIRVRFDYSGDVSYRIQKLRFEGFRFDSEAMITDPGIFFRKQISDPSESDVSVLYLRYDFQYRGYTLRSGVHLERGSVIGCLQRLYTSKYSSGTFLQRKKGRRRIFRSELPETNL
ncbi:hypothetical protein F511_28647 [Dorcoceras hygrometricum]|uniref:Uncharacterized protein n=1 Tax=Dorcoceras hygrometricum TaxID=472368 RepID=A0A2Z7AKN3_9LAMI|nr:hypothetical protein F511_28647 [Dorcoceras hygrometricum]